MRLLCTFENEGQGNEFSQLLKSEGINHTCEALSNSDWGSDAYGNRYCRIWIIDEDQVDRAEELHQEYLANPDDPRFKQKPNLIKHILEPEKSKLVAKEGLAKIQKAASTWQSQPIGFVTLYLMIICTLIFMWGVTSVSQQKLPPSIAPLAALAESPLQRVLLFDYPKAYEALDKLISLYTLDSENDQKPEQPLPPEAQYLLDQYRKTPIWTGLYEKVVLALKGHRDKINWEQPMFEKIRQGEIWRFFTPTLLHSDILHLFFNMIWLLILGKQIERRIGMSRYVIFILISAAFSDTMQYLMSGPNFVGISGVLCAMLGFIYMRQRKAAWEGYQLQRVTLGFLGFFILTMLGVQMASFISEIYWNFSLAPRIANTAHLSGVAIGLLLGKLDYFAWKKG